MKLRVLIITVFAIFCLTPVTAQKGKSTSAKSKYTPKWVNKLPKAGNNTYVYIVGSATAESLEGAHLKTLNDMAYRIPQNLRIKIREVADENVSQSTGGRGQASRYDENMDVRTTTIVDGEPIYIYCRPVDEYWELNRIGGKQMFSIKTIYQVATQSRNVRFDDVESTTQYAWGGVWRSAMLPGWGQLYKRNTAKGVSILCATAGLAGGIIATETKRADYTKRMAQTHNVTHIKHYQTKADNMALTRNILIGGTAALYIWNIIDAKMAEGAAHIVPVKNKRYTAALLPVVSDNYVGVYFGATF